MNFCFIVSGFFVVYVIDSVMEKEFSAFSLMLIEIAHGLNEEEQSLVKLLLQANKIVSRAELDRMINSAEIIRELLYKHLITDDNVKLLKELLIHIDRKDLVREICKYQDVISGAEETQEDTLPSSQESITDEEKLYKIEKNSEIFTTDFEMCSQ